MTLRTQFSAVWTLDWRRFINRLYEISDESDLFNRAAQAAFYFSFALFPFLFFLVSLSGLVLESTDNLKAELFSYMRQIMPGSVFVLVRNTVNEAIANSSTGKLALSLIATLWSASSGVDAVRAALNAIYGLKERRTWVWLKAQSILLTIVVTVLAGIGLTIVFYGWQLFKGAFDTIDYPITSPLVLVGIQWLSIVIVMLLLCEFIYNFLPDFRKFRWIWLTPGSLVAITLWLLLTSGFRLYLHYFNTYDRTYGSLGAVIILLLWLYLTSLTVMVGGAINAAWNEINDRDEDEELLKVSG